MSRSPRSRDYIRDDRENHSSKKSGREESSHHDKKEFAKKKPNALRALPRPKVRGAIQLRVQLKSLSIQLQL